MKRLFGWVLGVVVIVFLIVVLSPSVPTNGKRRTKKESSMMNIKQLALSTEMYCADFDDRYPLAYSTNDELKFALMPYAKNDRLFYSYNPDDAVFLGNKDIEGKELTDIASPYKTINLFESKDWAEYDGRITAYADGHAEFVEGFDERMLAVEFSEPTSAQKETQTSE